MGLLTRVRWLRLLLPPPWGMLQDTDISASIGTELCPCWLWLEKGKAIRDVAAGWAAPGVATAVASAQCRGLGTAASHCCSRELSAVVDFGFCMSS